MKWVYGIEQKRKAALLLVIVLVIVGAKNILDKRSMSLLSTSFSAVYEDRLVAEGYIFHLSEIMHARLHELQQPAVEGLQQQRADMNRLITAYGHTKLTEQEAGIFREFRAHILAVATLEDRFLETHEPALQQQIVTQYNQAFAVLLKLSGIQLTEGYALKKQSEKIVAGSALLNYMELALLIAIGAVLMALIQASRMLPIQTVRQELN